MLYGSQTSASQPIKLSKPEQQQRSHWKLQKKLSNNC